MKPKPTMMKRIEYINNNIKREKKTTKQQQPRTYSQLNFTDVRKVSTMIRLIQIFKHNFIKHKQNKMPEKNNRNIF